MQLTVDATELPRKLLHSEITFNLTGSDTVLYPKWWPGHHGPVGAVGNIGGLTFTDADGKTIAWERDWQGVYRFFLKDANENAAITADLTYIANQPTDNTIGCDSYRDFELSYNGGLRYDKLVPVAGRHDWLKEIMASRVKK